MSCCESCGSITLFKGEDGTTIYNGVGAPTIGANEGDFYIDTETWEIYGPYTGGSWGSGTFLIGPTGATGAAGVGITNIAWTSNSDGQPQGTEGTTDTYTITLSDASTYNFVVTNGADSNSEYGNTVFVDKIYGNNATGTRERFNLPFLTISAAITAASSGDTVYVRSGNYTENIILKTGVDLQFENVTLNGQITDNGTTVVCNILGENLDIIHTSSNALFISGTNSNVKAIIGTISSTSSAISNRPGVGLVSSLTLTIKKIFNQSFDYFITCDGNSKTYINVLELMESAPITSSTIRFMGIFIRDYSGEFFLTCPKVIIGNSTFQDSGILMEEEFTCSGGVININIEDVDILYDYVSPNEEYSINKVGSAKTIININRLKSIARGGLLVTGATEAIGYLKFIGNIVSERQPAFRYASVHKCIIKESSLKRNSGGGNLDETVVIGNPAGYSAVTNGITNGYKLEIVNTEIIKDKGKSPGSASGIIAKSGVPEINIKDCDIYGFNIFTGNSAIATVGEGNILFKNTLGNTALGANVVDISAARGFSVDSGLDLYDYID